MSSSLQASSLRPTYERVEGLLGKLVPRPHTTAGTVLLMDWLPTSDLDGVLDGLAGMRERAASAADREEAAQAAFDDALHRREDLERIRRDAAEAGIAAELPSTVDAEQAIDDARLILDAARENRAREAVAVFVAVREREEAWRSAAGSARTEAEQAEAEAEAALADAPRDVQNAVRG
jgi:flagellar hook-length control protein FliK